MLISLGRVLINCGNDGSEPVRAGLICEIGQAGLSPVKQDLIQNSITRLVDAFLKLLEAKKDDPLHTYGEQQQTRVFRQAGEKTANR